MVSMGELQIQPFLNPVLTTGNAWLELHSQGGSGRFSDTDTHGYSNTLHLTHTSTRAHTHIHTHTLALYLMEVSTSMDEIKAEGFTH